MAEPTTAASAAVAASAASAANPSSGMDVNFGIAVNHVQVWIDGAIRLLPNIIVGAVVMVVFYLLGLLAQRLVKRGGVRSSRENLGEVLGGFLKWVVILLGFLLAATVIIPSLKPADLIGGLGVSSVAIGFAFKDILQNWLAGLLILIRQPFQVNDQIVVNGYEGTVARIETRATIIRTYDGQRIVVPNSDIYTNAVTVRTAHDQRRSQYDVGIGYGDGIEHARQVLVDAVSTVPEVQQDPKPEALTWDLAASWVTIRVRWWTDSRRSDVVHVKAKVLTAIKQGLDEAGIDMPYDTQVQLFHDQTESDDGVRGTQREGWPKPKDGNTEPRWKAQAKATQTKEENGAQ